MALSLPTDYQQFIATSRYAKWLEDEGRRETFEETTERYINFMYNQVKGKTDIKKKDLHKLYGLLGASCEE